MSQIAFLVLFISYCVLSCMGFAQEKGGFIQEKPQAPVTEVSGGGSKSVSQAVSHPTAETKSSGTKALAQAISVARANDVLMGRSGRPPSVLEVEHQIQESVEALKSLEAEKTRREEVLVKYLTERAKNSSATNRLTGTRWIAKVEKEERLAQLAISIAKGDEVLHLLVTADSADPMNRYYRPMYSQLVKRARELAQPHAWESSFRSLMEDFDWLRTEFSDLPPVFFEQRNEWVQMEKARSRLFDQLEVDGLRATRLRLGSGK